MEPESPAPDILPFQTSRLRDIKSTSNLTKYDIILRSSEKDEFSCQPKSLLTNICLLCLAVPFQHWHVLHEKQPPTVEAHQLPEYTDFAKN